ncbi:hypothetical protein GJ496_008836 [Pomphorhynchus laevis]|nr:hypothetical protein GJ496_008836 [Pomphorhynchus laevis]
MNVYDVLYNNKSKTSNYCFSDSATDLDMQRAHLEFADMIIEAIEGQQDKPNREDSTFAVDCNVDSTVKERARDDPCEYFEIYVNISNGLPSCGKYLFTTKPLPSEFESSIRGNERWAPPRPQIIFTEHSNITANKSDIIQEMIDGQHSRCAGCGLVIYSLTRKSINANIKKCAYFGKYFCSACISTNLSFLPARILSRWDFRSIFTISKIAEKFLYSIYKEPLFDLSKTPVLTDPKDIHNIKRLRLMLSGAVTYVNDCSMPSSDINEIRTLLSTIGNHLYSHKEIHIYSLEDLFQTRSDELIHKLRSIYHTITDHIHNCGDCSSKYFSCSLCSNKSKLYPFEIDKIWQCKGCDNCFHINCLVKYNSKNTTNELACPVCTTNT